MWKIGSVSNAVKGQSITDDAKLREAGERRIQKHKMAFSQQLSVYTMALLKGGRQGRNMIFREKFLTHFFFSRRVCSEIWGDPEPGATFKCFPECRSRPRGNNSFCKWANIAEDIFGLMELGWLVDILGAACFGKFLVFSAAKPIQSATIEWFNSEASAFPREQKQKQEVPGAL